MSCWDKADTDVKDPVCGIKVDPAKAAESVEHNETMFYFCSQGCASKFRANPRKYLHPQTAAMPKPKPKDKEKQMEYVCPMNPDVSKIGPRNCPKCGMALEPKAISAPALAQSTPVR